MHVITYLIWYNLLSTSRTSDSFTATAHGRKDKGLANLWLMLILCTDTCTAVSAFLADCTFTHCNHSHLHTLLGERWSLAYQSHTAQEALPFQFCHHVIECSVQRAIRTRNPERLYYHSLYMVLHSSRTRPSLDMHGRTESDWWRSQGV